MMRITNAMMTSNTKNNININKLNEDRLNTQMATGQKISRPSDDPVVAIRALRLNTNLSQLNQYYDKNIPDASAWMKVTETALSQTDQIFTNIKENLTTGASDTNTATDRQKILTSLKGLREELYSSGNADYAGRTVFTGYRTGESLTFLATDKDLEHDIRIHDTFTMDDIEEDYPYVVSTDITSTGQYEQTVEEKEIHRLRLSYDRLNVPDDYSEKLCVTKITEGPAPDYEPTRTVINSFTVNVKHINQAGMTQQAIDDVYTNVTPGTVTIIPETGEVILADDVYNTLSGISDYTEISLEYNKGGSEESRWQAGDLRPEHYFACVDETDGTYFNYYQKADGTIDTSKPNFKDQDMEIEISFNQKITINTHADEVYSHDIGRGLDDLLRVTQDVVDAEEKLDKCKKDLAAATDPAAKEDLQKLVDSYEKEFSFKKDKMQRMFSEAIDIYEGYADRNNVAIANIGSLQSRLEVTKERVKDQLQSFKELADSNINAEVTDTAIDLKSAELALEAAQLAASKIAQQTLLNYL